MNNIHRGLSTRQFDVKEILLMSILQTVACPIGWMVGRKTLEWKAEVRGVKARLILIWD